MSFHPRRAASSTESLLLPPPIHIASRDSCTGDGWSVSPLIDGRYLPDQVTGLPLHSCSSSSAFSANRSLDSSMCWPNKVYVDSKKLPRPETMSTRPFDRMSSVE